MYTMERPIERPMPIYYWVGHYHYPGVPWKRNWYIAEYDHRTDTFIRFDDEDEHPVKNEHFDWVSHRVPDPYELRHLHDIMNSLENYISERENGNVDVSNELYNQLRDRFMIYKNYVEQDVDDNERPTHRLDDAY